MNLYRVVRFLRDRKVSSVPSSWIITGGRNLKCFWPMYGLNKKLRNCVPPPLEVDVEERRKWKVLDCCLLTKREFRSYEEGDRAIAEIESSIEGSDGVVDSSIEEFNADETVNNVETSVNVSNAAQRIVHGVDNNVCYTVIKSPIEELVPDDFAAVSFASAVTGIEPIIDDASNVETVHSDGAVRQIGGPIVQSMNWFQIIIDHRVLDVDSSGAASGILIEDKGAIGEQLTIVANSEKGIVDSDDKEVDIVRNDEPGAIAVLGKEENIGGNGDQDASIRPNEGAIGEHVEQGNIVVNNENAAIERSTNQEAIGIELVPWTKVLPIDCDIKLEQTKENLDDTVKLEELRNIYRSIDEADRKSFLNKIILKTFEKGWFCDHIGFRAYNEKIEFDGTKLMDVWLDALEETWCKDLNKAQRRSILVAHCTQFRNTYNKNKARQDKKK